MNEDSKVVGEWAELDVGLEEILRRGARRLIQFGRAGEKPVSGGFGASQSRVGTGAHRMAASLPARESLRLLVG